MRGTIEETGRARAGARSDRGRSTDHFQLVITETHKEPGRRWFLSPFGRVLDATRRMGSSEFDETFVIEEYFLPRAHGFAEAMGVPIVTGWDAETRIISVALAD